MAAHPDPPSASPFSPLWAVDLGRRLFEPSRLEQWISYTTGWVEPMADLGAGTVTALLPDTVLTVLSEGILSRFGGREISATVLDHHLTGTLDVLKVRRRGAHFQTKAVLRDLLWDGLVLDEVTVIAHEVRLVPGVPTRMRSARVDIDGTVTSAALLDRFAGHARDWELSVTGQGIVRAVHRRRRISAELDASITDDVLELDVHRATWFGMPVPPRWRTTEPIRIPELPSGARVRRAVRDGELVRFRIEVAPVSGSFDLAQIRSAIVAGTTLIVF
ncbi:hypothetical protein IU448_14050 [Nocardia flavorosea]|uniref:hypothetical protein n=1 Tax=Nocardia flavorosea TaxID=53429 RepID=UPI001896218C|nr:hypothetical protein [Nocardia flavorosea]MBF6350128.1 hypothetical protein [Nocardia flavorosea]